MVVSDCGIPRGQGRDQDGYNKKEKRVHCQPTEENKNEHRESKGGISGHDQQPPWGRLAGVSRTCAFAQNQSSQPHGVPGGQEEGRGQADAGGLDHGWASTGRAVVRLSAAADDGGQRGTR